MSKDDPSSTRAPASPFNRAAQHDAKRMAILSQAARLFNYKGSRATTLKDIAETLGLTKTSLYYYVRTKEELIYQCYLAALDHYHRSLDDIERLNDQPLGRARAFFLQQFDSWQAAQEGRGIHIAALLEIAALKGERRREVEARYIDLFKRLRRYFHQAMADGSAREAETTALTRAILGSLEWAFSWLHQVPEGELGDAAEQAWDIIARGLYSGPGYYRPTSLEQPVDADTRLSGFDRQQQHRLKQEAFYKTATRFFNTQGFYGTSLDEIAEQLDVSKGAFYYHIRNKEDLLFSCYNRSLDIMQAIHARMQGSQGSGLQKIEQTCRLYFHVQNSESGPLIRYNTITALPMARRLEILERTEITNAVFGDFIRAGQADGSIRQISTFIARQLLAGAVNASMDIGQWRSVEDIDRAATDYFDVFLNGIIPRE